ncbi:hypothetical protein [Nonomuraea sp. PA05]|uniref:hypothetical protein n=1 Tax=Nonomuraea sp. PA05 TaxID=2604466 RepID=UPI0021CCC753|nr:hypothetical protein [Nonomuraea sp. PA05]
MAASAPGTENPIDDSPLETSMVFGSYVGYMRAIHIFTAPVSARTMSSRPMAARMSATTRRGDSGNPPLLQLLPQHAADLLAGNGRARTGLGSP